jgi:serine/threonine protein kinase
LKNTIEANPSIRILVSNPIDKPKTSTLSRSESAVTGSLSSQAKNISKTMKDDFEFQGLLGEGTYGKVFLAKHFFTAKFYAIKVIEKKKVL